MSESSVSLIAKKVVQLDGKKQPDEVITPSDAADVTKLAKLLTRILGNIALLARSFRPDAVTFRDIAVSGTTGAPTVFQLAHKLGGRVEWWMTRITPQAGGSIAGTATPLLVETFNDGQTLTLRASFTASIDVRVQRVP